MAGNKLRTAARLAVIMYAAFIGTSSARLNYDDNNEITSNRLASYSSRRKATRDSDMRHEPLAHTSRSHIVISASRDTPRSRRQAHSSLNSADCLARSSCSNGAKGQMTSFVTPFPAMSSSTRKQLTSPSTRNCYCDSLCFIYNDCCSDYIHFRNYPAKKKETGESVELVPVSPLPTDVVSCEYMPELLAEQEVYIVRACPKSFNDDAVIVACESGHEAIEETFHAVPVTGMVSRILYANYYCAVCNGEHNVTLWQAKVNCNRFHNANANAQDVNPHLLLRHTLRHYATHDCEIEYRHPSPSYATRTCLSHIGRCDKSWADEEVKRQCRSHTSYVYAGVRAFRNKFCAMCNYVNVSYVSCDDRRYSIITPPNEDNLPSVRTHVFMATIDLNVGYAMMQIRRPHHPNGTMSNEYSELKVDFVRCPLGHIHDPFTDACRRLNCPVGFLFRDGYCLPVQLINNSKQLTFSNTLHSLSTSDSITQLVPVTIAQLFQAAINYTTNCSSSTIFYHSNIPMFPIAGTSLVDPANFRNVASGCYELNATSVVMVQQHQNIDEQQQQHLMMMFKFTDLQKILSLTAGIVSSATLLIHVLIYSASTSLKRSIRSKCHVSMCCSLTIAQFFYVIRDALHDLLPKVACTGVAIAMHYSQLVSFFWITTSSYSLYEMLRCNKRGGKRRRFVILSSLSYLIPFLLVLVGLTVHLARPNTAKTTPIYLQQYCWLCNTSALICLFLIPIGVTVVADCAIYIAILRIQQRSALTTCTYEAISLDKSRSGHGGAGSSGGNGSKRVRIVTGSLTTPPSYSNLSKTHRRSLGSYALLLILMTLSWMMAIFAAIFSRSDTKQSDIWFIFIACQAAIGPMMCLTFSFPLRNRHKEDNRDDSKTNGTVIHNRHWSHNTNGNGVFRSNRETDSCCSTPPTRRELRVVARETSI